MIDTIAFCLARYLDIARYFGFDGNHHGSSQVPNECIVVSRWMYDMPTFGNGLGAKIIPKIEYPAPALHAPFLSCSAPSLSGQIAMALAVLPA
jgi:hypothetical protein